jgi:hypothetical protein
MIISYGGSTNFAHSAAVNTLMENPPLFITIIQWLPSRKLAVTVESSTGPGPGTTLPEEYPPPVIN